MGCIVVESEKTGRTTKKGVFAGGYIVTGAAAVIKAAGADRDAGTAIDKFLFCCLPPRSAVPCA